MPRIDTGRLLSVDTVHDDTVSVLSATTTRCGAPVYKIRHFFRLLVAYFLERSIFSVVHGGTTTSSLWSHPCKSLHHECSQGTKWGVFQRNNWIFNTFFGIFTFQTKWCLLKYTWLKSTSIIFVNPTFWTFVLTWYKNTVFVHVNCMMMSVLTYL